MVRVRAVTGRAHVGLGQATIHPLFVNRPISRFEDIETEIDATVELALHESYVWMAPETQLTFVICFSINRIRNRFQVIAIGSTSIFIQLRLLFNIRCVEVDRRRTSVVPTTDALSSYTARQNRFDLSGADAAIDAKVAAAVETIDARNAKIVTDLQPVAFQFPDGSSATGLYAKDQADMIRRSLNTRIGG